MVTAHFVVLVLLLPFVCCVSLRVKEVESTSKPLTRRDSDNDDYGYSYGVSDSTTGDHKTHWEKRENGVVQGAYSLLEPDGSTRLVQYTADDSGFHPLVQKLNQPNLQVTTPANYVRPSPYRPGIYYNRPIYPNTGYNYDGRYYFPDNYSIRPPYLYDRDYRYGYGNYLNRYSGYDSTYKGYAPRTPSASPYNYRERVDHPAVPLLHSTYHGYDNLYH